MAGIDNRIVTMKFDNAQFESGARTSMSTLEKLKQGMDFGTAGAAATKTLGGISGLFAKFGIKNPFSTAEKGAADLGKAAQGATGGVASIDGAVTGVSARFIALSTIAITALSNITTRAMSAGSEIAKALTIDPIKMGLQEYELNMNSIQTILANTKVSGADLGDVNKALDELNRYSDKTIYNFAEMAKNIGTFTAAGVDLDTSVSSIKGIANLAALSGSNSQQAATAMYQLSQEIAAGRVSLMGWNSVVNAGMGGSTFQRALAQTAVAMGEIDASAVKLDGKMKNVKVNGQSFRDSIMAKPGEQSWLSSDVLLKTLEQFTGDMSKAELKAQGFNDQQIKAIQEMAKTASDAATKVKTLNQVYDVAKETAQSGWSQSFRLIFGDFEEARALFTEFSNYVNGFLNRSADARNKVLGSWKELGGRDVMIEGFKELGAAILSIVTPIRDAFQDIFPPKTGEQLYDMTVMFRDFAKNLAIGADTAEGLRATFRGVFAIFSIVGKVIGGIAAGIGEMFGALGEGSGGLLSFTGGIGNTIVALNDFLERSGVIKEFFTTLGGFLALPIKLLSGIAGLIGNMFGAFDTGAARKVTGAVDDMGNALEPVKGLGEQVAAIFEKLGDVFSRIGEVIADALSNIGNLISGAITPETFSGTLDVINTTLLGGILIMLRRFFTGSMSVDVTGGLFDGIKESLGAATGALQNMQQSLKADILLKIAAALALLTASLGVLALIDGKKLAKALLGMTVGFGVLTAVLIGLTTFINIFGALKLPLIAASMMMLAASMLALALALKVMSTIPHGEMINGLIGMAASLFIISKAMARMPLNMPVTAAGILILSVAMNLLAIALKTLGTMSWEEMAKGMVGLAGSLVLIGTAMRLMPLTLPITAAGMLILSVALNALATAMKIFGSMGWEEMAKGMVGLAGSLVLIALAMSLMPLTLPLTAAGLILVATAVNGLAIALKVMGGMSWGEVAKGLVSLGGAILILALGLNAMGPMALVGAAALAIAAASLAVLAPILVTFGSMDWMTILKSLTMLAGVFVVLGLAGLILTPLIPTILALGAALVLIGAGLALAGAGALAFATAFGIIVSTGMAGVQILASGLATIIAAIPGFFTALGKAMGNFASEIAKSGPKFTRAMSAIISSLLNAVIKNVPKMGRAFLAMLNTALKVIVTASPKIFNAGIRLIIGFLSAIERNIDKIVDLAASIIIKFINGIARNIGGIIQAGVNLIIRFIEGVTRAINNNSDRMGRAGGELAAAIVRGMATGIWNGVDAIKDAAVGAAKDALQAAKDWLMSNSPSKRARDELGKPISQGMAIGIADEADKVSEAAADMGRGALASLRTTMEGMSEVLDITADMSPVVTPVLDLTSLTRDANKMSNILATAPIMAGVSYQTAADISSMTQSSSDDDGSDDGAGGGRGDTYVSLEQHNHSPKPIDSVETYRGGKTLISLAKEALS